MICAVGDIHGCVRSLDSLINETLKRYQVSEWIFIGDYIDRGPDSAGVVSLVQELAGEYAVTPLIGNHEEFMLDWVYGTMKYSPAAWLDNGGRETISSYLGRDVAFELARGDDLKPEFKDALEKDREFYDNLQVCAQRITSADKYIFSHSGVGEGSDEEHRTSMVKHVQNYKFFWSRHIDENCQKYMGHTQVHGHTPVGSLSVNADGRRPYINKNKKGEVCTINVDTGCVYGFTLSCVLITDDGGLELVSTEKKD